MPPKAFLGPKDQKYQTLLQVYQKTNPEKPFLTAQAEVRKIWRDELGSGNADEKKFKDKITELKTKLEKKGSIMMFMSKAPKKKVTTEEPQEKNKVEVVEEVKNEEEVDVDEEEERDEEETVDNRKACLAQEKMKSEIQTKEKKLLVLIEEREIDDGLRTRSLAEDIKKTKDDIKKLKANLKHKQNVAKATQKWRLKKKQFEDTLKRENPELAKALKLREGPGRPRIECDNPGNQ